MAGRVCGPLNAGGRWQAKLVVLRSLRSWQPGSEGMSGAPAAVAPWIADSADGAAGTLLPPLSPLVFGLASCMHLISKKWYLDPLFVPSLLDVGPRKGLQISKRMLARALRAPCSLKSAFRASGSAPAPFRAVSARGMSSEEQAAQAAAA